MDRIKIENAWTPKEKPKKKPPIKQPAAAPIPLNAKRSNMIRTLRGSRK